MPGHGKDVLVEVDQRPGNAPTRLIHNPPVYNSSGRQTELNLIRLDVHLTQNENAVAFHLCDRMLNLDLNEVHRPAVIAKKIRALCALRQIGPAKVLLATLLREYPYSPGVREAQSAVEALTADKR